MIKQELKKELNKLVGKTVISSNAGGAASSILLVKFDNDFDIWAWRYWEVIYKDEIVGCSEDDDTPNTGKMSVAANKLKNRIVNKIELIEKNLSLSICFDNNFELRIFTEKETNKEFFSVVNWEYEQPSEDSCYIVTSQVKLEKTKYWD
ncbi:MAG: hypothetical protein J6I37_04895 [Prevotella sp.]|nr:hypothetical protein [Prevotella sp.]